MNRMQFAQNFIHLKGQPITFPDRNYLVDIYGCSARRLVLRTSRQVEKTQYMTNSVVYLGAVHANVRIVCVFPRREQARYFSNSRLQPMLKTSPILARALLGSGARIQVDNLRLANGTEINIRAAYNTADAARGLDGDFLFVDEFQDIAPGNLPVLEECLSHSPHQGIVLTGTPKLAYNHLEAAFRDSTACEWQVPCPDCCRGVLLDERVLGPSGPICHACQAPIDPRRGVWVPRNPHATWAAGYWINHLMVPWQNYDKILERRRTYDLAQFKNEVLGLPTSLGDHVVTREELEACCTNASMARTFKDISGGAGIPVVAGIDWGGGGTSRTVVTIGVMWKDFCFSVYHFQRFDPEEAPAAVVDAVAKLCRNFRVTMVAADGGGNGHVYNRLLWEKLEAVPRSHFYAILYSAVDQEPQQDGVLWNWTVNRSKAIGTLFSRVKSKKIQFPRAADCGTFLDEFACEIAEHDDVSRSVKYTHPTNQQDDAMHATNYALLLGTLWYHAAR